MSHIPKAAHFNLEGVVKLNMAVEERGRKTKICERGAWACLLSGPVASFLAGETKIR
jgi:hypothetical protein